VILQPIRCQSCAAFDWVTPSPSSQGRWLCRRCIPEVERDSSWPAIAGDDCRFGFEEYDGARYCYAHGGIQEKGSSLLGISWCDRRQAVSA